MILEEKTQILIFSLQYKTLISLNQGQGSIFTLRECAKLIFRIEITLKSRFLEENRKHFRVETHFYLIFRVKLNFSRFENARNRFFA